MTPLEFEKIQKNGLASFLQNQPTKPQPTKIDSKPDGDFNLAPFLAVLNSIHLPKRHLTTPPTFTPQNFADQIQIVDDGVTKSLYAYINQTWVQIASGAVAGNDKSVQYNDGGVAGGSDEFQFDLATHQIDLGSTGNDFTIHYQGDATFYISANGNFISISPDVISLLSGGGDYAELYTNNLTNNRAFTFPDLDGTFAIIQDSPPSSASDTGIAGAIAYDSDYLYVCIATNTWKRTALSTW